MTESAQTNNEVKTPQASTNPMPPSSVEQEAAPAQPPKVAKTPEANTTVNSTKAETTNSNYVASSNKLFVGGLANLNHTNEMLEEYFSKWGKVLSFALIKDATQRSKGYGFVTFEQVDSASACLNQTQHFIEGRSISVKNCKEKERHGGRPYQNSSYSSSPNYQNHYQRSPGHHQYQNHGGYYGRGGPMQHMHWGGHNGRPYMNSHHSPEHLHHQADSMSTKSNNSHRNNATPRTNTPNKFDDELSVYVGGVPHMASEQDLTSHFSRFGIVEAVSVAKNKDNQEPRGFAFVTFQSKEDRNKCLESREQHSVNNRILRVEKKRISNKTRDRHHPGGPGRIKHATDSARSTTAPVSPEIMKSHYGQSIPITNHIQQYFPHYQNQHVYPQYLYHHGPVYQPYIQGNNVDQNMVVNQPIIMPQQMMQQPPMVMQQAHNHYQQHPQQHPGQMGYNMYQSHHQSVAPPIQEKDNQAVNTA
ncbi:Oidioi.mRNA.OKI2018_I69.PAR.g12662.t1.cds [Oikopleura dioica]|uniref:Oidioi.mRNA.OKI2018_I69.PAR.g12662.t1.cds n=1 Tax=Oikopleura dioica TaxID=34765 RepID=A0ABN7S104_OIKDI|nr:Oidioi.mRNA.OKI2018_I69.PAR.g12662.t1.cds [Oikopleura dioica]